MTRYTHPNEGIAKLPHGSTIENSYSMTPEQHAKMIIDLEDGDFLKANGVSAVLMNSQAILMTSNGSRHAEMVQCLVMEETRRRANE